MTEIWKSFGGGIYEASNMGRIRSVDRAIVYKDGRTGLLKGRTLRGSLGANGYLTLTLPNRRKVLIHRVIADLFCENPSNNYVVNHKDGNKTNNAASNLEWGTYAQNNKHARDTGLNRQHGERCNLTKFSDQIIDAMRRLDDMYSPDIKTMAEIFGMSKTHVSEVLSGKSRSA